LAEFLDDIDKRHEDADEYMIMSASEPDEDMVPPSSEDEDLSFGEENAPTTKKAPKQQQEIRKSVPEKI